MELKADDCQRAANAVTFGRLVLLGGVLDRVLVSSKDSTGSWGQTGAYMLVSAGDAFDGYLSRMHPDGPTPEGAQLDQEADKVASYATKFALFCNNRINATLFSALIDIPRDYAVNRKRAELRENNLDAKARKFGKIKTAAEILTNSFEISPLGKKYRRTLTAMRVGSTALSIFSGLEFIKASNLMLQTVTNEDEEYVKKV